MQIELLQELKKCGIEINLESYSVQELANKLKEIIKK